MAAPMARATRRVCRCLFLRNTGHFQQFRSLDLHHASKVAPRLQSRTLSLKSCLNSPRIKTHTPSELGQSAAARHRETDKSTPAKSANPSAVDCSDGPSDVRIYGDVTEAAVPYRRRVERELRRSEADDASSVTDNTTAKTLAMKIRKDLGLKRKGKEEKTNFYSSIEKAGDVDQSAPDKRKGLDSKGFRTLLHQVQDLSRLQEDTVASILYRSVIYNKGDLVAIDKPYGLPSHGGPGIVHSVDSLLPLLVRKLRLYKSSTGNARLHLVHRLDKETTGVMLLAKTEETAQRLHRMFIRQQVGKTYLAVTVGVPEPGEGVVDIPMVEREFAGGRHRMGIRPDIGAVYKNLGKTGSGGSTRAVTNFRVLCDNGSAALVEIKPETGVKHQIRVHMALGMACPVLGDHKYSHHDKLAPQKLPMSILHSLGIRQAKARTVPMQLHAREVALPEFLDGRNLFISTRVPEFFQQNMRRLKLKMP